MTATPTLPLETLSRLHRLCIAARMHWQEVAKIEDAIGEEIERARKEYGFHPGATDANS